MPTILIRWPLTRQETFNFPCFTTEPVGLCTVLYYLFIPLFFLCLCTWFFWPGPVNDPHHSSFVVHISSLIHYIDFARQLANRQSRMGSISYKGKWCFIESLQNAYKSSGGKGKSAAFDCL